MIKNDISMSQVAARVQWWPLSLFVKLYGNHVKWLILSKVFFSIFNQFHIKSKPDNEHYYPTNTSSDWFINVQCSLSYTNHEGFEHDSSKTFTNIIFLTHSLIGSKTIRLIHKTNQQVVGLNHMNMMIGLKDSTFWLLWWHKCQFCFSLLMIWSSIAFIKIYF